MILVCYPPSTGSRNPVAALYHLLAHQKGPKVASNEWDHENLDALDGLQKGDVEPLISLLEDVGRPLHAELRLWLALMLKGDTQTRWWLQCMRHPGFQKPDDMAIVRPWFIGVRIHQLWSEGGTITAAKVKAKSEFHRGIRSIDGAWIDYRKLYFRLKGQGIDLCPGLRPLRQPIPRP